MPDVPTSPAADDGPLSTSELVAELTARLSETQRRLADSQRIAHIGHWELDFVKDRLYWSDEVFNIFGLSKEQFKADYDTFFATIHPDDRAVFAENQEKVLRGEAVINREYRIVLPNKSVRFAHELGEVTFDKEKRPVWISGTVQDITNRKLAELKLEANEKRFRALVQNGMDMIGIVDELGNYTYVSPTVEHILGYTADFFLGQNAFSFIHPDDLGDVLNGFNRLKDTLHLTLKPFRFLDKAGNWKWIETTVTNLLDDPIIHGIVANSRDITQRKLVQDEIEKLSLIAKETSNAVVITNAEGQITWVNNAFTAITEYELEEALLQKPGMLLQGTGTNPDTVRYMQEKISSEQPFDCEIINYTKSGREYWVHIQGQPLFDPSGNCVKFFAIQSDITERKLAEKKITSSEERYRQLFYKNPLSMWIFDRETLTFLDVNEAALDCYGYSRDEFLQMNTKQIRPEYDLGRYLERVKSHFYNPERTEHGIWTHRTKKGDLLDVEIYSHNITFKDRKAALIICSNITEKLQLQRKLDQELISKEREITEAIVDAQEKERLEISKELHDNVNQILGAAKLYVGAIVGHQGKENVNAIVDKTLELLSNAIEEIRILSKALAGPAMDTINLAEGIEQLAGQIVDIRPIAVSIEKGSYYDLGLSEKLKRNIFRIVQEQLNNIVKHANATQITVLLSRDSQRLMLTISDNGQGFDTTTKRKGIGINNIINRAQLHDGTVMIDSAPGKGCALKVELKI